MIIIRLWHEALIKHLPNQQLLGQHRECAALRGLGWGRKHSTVDYVFKYQPIRLFRYHVLIMNEMKRRGYKYDPIWFYVEYSGKRCEPWKIISETGSLSPDTYPIYPEHNDDYLADCLENLRGKGIEIAI